MQSRRRAGVPDHSSDHDRRGVREVRRERSHARRVRDRRVRALRDERLRGCLGGGCARDDRDVVAGPRLHVGGALHRRRSAPADRHGERQPCARSAHQHPLRPLGHHGRSRYRLDHPVRRDRAGGLRQHHHERTHRRASRRDAAGDDVPRRLHHHALDRPCRDHGRRERRRSSWASTCRRTRCSTPTTP